MLVKIDFCGGAFFTYASGKRKKKICKIELGVAGCTLQLWGNHFAAPNNILPEANRKHETRFKNVRPCGACANNNPNFIRCTRRGAHNSKSMVSITSTVVFIASIFKQPESF
ncbi:MAG: hypothetical protein FWB87_09440 [Defluviitaleaceae bacterium]|nr:hypothetical protein [Defluviitaleaceae bacterium]